MPEQPSTPAPDPRVPPEPAAGSADAGTADTATANADIPAPRTPDAESPGAESPDAGHPAPDGVRPEEAADQPEEAADQPEEAADQPEGASAVRQRVTLAGGVLAALLALLGFTLVAQVRSLDTDESLPAARQEELVRILADLDAHEQRLRQEIAELEATLERLTTAGESREEALEQAAQRADELGVLAGILPVQGPGLTVDIQASPDALNAARLLDAVQELRGAGAEAIQITGGGTAVRVVASTYFVDTETGAINVDGRLLRSPFVITAVGDPATLGPALAIPGGVVETVQSAGGTVTLHEHPDGVEITAVREQAPLQHASPDS